MPATYPEHGTGRSAPLATCAHCHGKPLIIRRCPADQREQFCAVCQACGHHAEVSNTHRESEAQHGQARLAQLHLDMRQIKAILGRIESGARKPPKSATRAADAS